MKLRIEIELDNAAFQETCGEMSRILCDLAGRLPDEPPYRDEGEYAIHDTNGNWCGYARILHGTINRGR